MRDRVVPSAEPALEERDDVGDLARVGHESLRVRQILERAGDVTAGVVAIVALGDDRLERAWRQPLGVLHRRRRPQRVGLQTTADQPAPRLREQAPRGDERRVQLHRALELTRPRCRARPSSDPSRRGARGSTHRARRRSSSAPASSAAPAGQSAGRAARPPPAARCLPAPRTGSRPCRADRSFRPTARGPFGASASATEKRT